MHLLSNKQLGQAASVLADDHSEMDTLIGDLLSALEEGDKSKALARPI